MTEKPPESNSTLVNKVDRKAKRKLKAKRHTKGGLWFGLGMMGIVGWSVMVPTLLGAGLGMWLDNRFPDGRSWTLALLIGGLSLGCLNAWHWIAKEEQAIRGEQSDDDNIS